MAEIVYLNDFIELKEIEIYTLLPVLELEEKLRANSPLEFLEKDETDPDLPFVSNFKLKDTEKIYGGWLDMYCARDAEDFPLPKSIESFLGGRRPRSEIITDENVSDASTFVPYYKPVIDYLKSQKIDFVMVGRDEEMKSEIIGWHIDGRTFINGSFRYPHKRLLE